MQSRAGSPPSPRHTPPEYHLACLDTDADERSAGDVRRHGDHVVRGALLAPVGLAEEDAATDALLAGNVDGLIRRDGQLAPLLGLLKQDRLCRLLRNPNQLDEAIQQWLAIHVEKALR